MKRPRRKLDQRVARFAKEYVQLVDALQREGVPQDVAREEARIAATSWLYQETEAEQHAQYDPAYGPCPTCGRG